MPCRKIRTGVWLTDLICLMRSSLTLSTGSLRQTSYERLILAYQIMVGHLLSETWLCARPCMAEHLEGRSTSPRLPRTKNRGKSLKFWYGFPGKFCPVWIPLKPELTSFWSLHEGELIGHMLVCFPVNLVLGTLNKKNVGFFGALPSVKFFSILWLGRSMGVGLSGYQRNTAVFEARILNCGF